VENLTCKWRDLQVLKFLVNKNVIPIYLFLDLNSLNDELFDSESYVSLVAYLTFGFVCSTKLQTVESKCKSYFGDHIS